MTDAPPLRCEACGYDLSGLPEDAVCPECGVDRAGRPPDAIGRCSTCGYDLTGLPEDAPCPECGATQEPLPIDAIAHQPVEMIGRVASGLALLAMTPMFVAASALVMIVGFAVLAVWPMLDIGFVVMVCALLVVIGTALVWLSGWILAAAAPVDAAAGGAMLTRQCVRACALVGCLAVLLSIALELMGAWWPTLGLIAAAPEYFALAAMGGTAVMGLWLIADLARRLQMVRTRDRAERGRFAACVVAGAGRIYLVSESIVITPGGLLGMFNLVLSLLALIGSVWLFGSLADFAATLRRRTAEVYEAKSGRKHWSSHRRFGLLWLRVGGILRRQPPN